ncbi:phenol 2-monooxygenase [Sphingobium sp. LB126]|uniref:FAD-dependent monooxygenase n=1 Tax=Sphingobium sp. LB126 TaxID=1983755 RepID=UPI000C201203|nr:FAD-dependent monooxygenase [Sphingobium sp. LB126]PJG46214.1 phenol 2-monooxygenase [Sphingobium sp. LB126]
MQFHLNGFRPGDPSYTEAAATILDPKTVPDAVDVLIVGCGPAGLTLAAQLSAFPDIRTMIIERKGGPLTHGQADGIACRTMEMFEAFGFADEIENEGYWVNEVTFWKPDARGGIVRSGRVRDVEEGLSEKPHIILNQARVHDRYLRIMANSPRRLVPYYSRQLVNLVRDDAADPDYPVTATIERIDDDGTVLGTETVRARYVVGCDGARSAVRQLIGRTLDGDSANHAWGVMDVLAVTDFPDVRHKAAIQSAEEGSILIIPREGGYLTRFYVELDALNENQRITEKTITIEQLVAAAQRIIKPFSLEVKEVAWWSCYQIGQRLTDKFDDVRDDDPAGTTPRIFIAGDACHTHSPKAGQGMNVSMQDAFNLGWKLAAVLSGKARPELLHSYSAERQTIARELIDFDREWAAMFSEKPKTSENDEGGIDPEEFRRYFIRQGRFTAGTATRYSPSQLTGTADDQPLATGFEIGTRFHSAPVERLADGKPLHLGHEIKADGRWRLFLFAGKEDEGVADSPVARLCARLARDANSPLRLYTREGEDPDAFLDIRAVFQQPRDALRIDRMPAILRPKKGRYGLHDYEKIFCAAAGPEGDIYDRRGIDRARGAMVVVRPDQYVAHVLPLDGIDRLYAFFAAFMRNG